METDGYALRCMRCLGGRITVPWGQQEVRCPHCGQGWRITWVTPTVAKIRGKVLSEIHSEKPRDFGIVTKEADSGKDSLHRPL